MYGVAPVPVWSRSSTFHAEDLSESAFEDYKKSSCMLIRVARTPSFNPQGVLQYLLGRQRSKKQHVLLQQLLNKLVDSLDNNMDSVRVENNTI